MQTLSVTNPREIQCTRPGEFYLVKAVTIVPSAGKRVDLR